MGLYGLGDTHLALGVPDKNMDIFGQNWHGYMEKLEESLYQLTAEDTLILCGDMGWGMSLEQSFADFEFLSRIPAKVLLLKGNHDYWWTSVQKMETFFQKSGFTNMAFLHNNAHFYGDVAICGTRGWFFEEDRGAHSEKVFRRELMRLEASLKAAGEREKYVFLHYPPVSKGYRCEEILELLHAYGVKHCCYGHLHGRMHHVAQVGMLEGIDFHLIAADYLDFIPKKFL